MCFMLFWVFLKKIKKLQCCPWTAQLNYWISPSAWESQCSVLGKAPFFLLAGLGCFSSEDGIDMATELTQVLLKMPGT